MVSSELAVPPAASAAEPAALSPIQRTVAIFVRPASAWVGLREQAQWWFPLLVVMLVNLAGSSLTYHRAQLPTILESMEERVANGEMTAQQMEQIEGFYSGPTGLAITATVATLWGAILLFVMALLNWFAIGFVLGKPFRYRHALEVTSWSWLVSVPALALWMGLAWAKQSMRGVHVGFGILLPEPEAGDKMLRAFGVFLDWIGPFGIWQLAVSILGASALSGAPRKSVGWALAILFVITGLCAAALAALMPGAA